MRLLEVSDRGRLGNSAARFLIEENSAEERKIRGRKRLTGIWGQELRLCQISKCPLCRADARGGGALGGKKKP